MSLRFLFYLYTGTPRMTRYAQFVGDQTYQGTVNSFAFSEFIPVLIRIEP